MGYNIILFGWGNYFCKWALNAVVNMIIVDSFSLVSLAIPFGRFDYIESFEISNLNQIQIYSQLYLNKTNSIYLAKNLKKEFFVKKIQNSINGKCQKSTFFFARKVDADSAIRTLIFALFSFF